MFEQIMAAMNIPIKPRTIIALGFSLLVAIVCISSFIALMVMKMRNPAADVEIFVNIFLTCLGYIIGILNGLLGMRSET